MEKEEWRRVVLQSNARCHFQNIQNVISLLPKPRYFLKILGENRRDSSRMTRIGKACASARSSSNMRVKSRK